MSKHRAQPHSERSRARRRATQALYQWHLAGGEPEAICAQFEQEQDFSQVDGSYFRRLVVSVAETNEALAQSLEPFLDRPFGQVDPLERGILLLGAYEILHEFDVPASVAINEAIELAKTFGATGSHAFVNSILDSLASSSQTESPRKQ